VTTAPAGHAHMVEVAPTHADGHVRVHAEGHDHADGHVHVHADGPTRPEAAPGPSPAASVVLDIGPHAGALVLYTPDDLAGAEIEIRPGGGTWQGAHTAVRQRRVEGRTLHAGVFGSLVPGAYDLRVKDGGSPAVALGVEVRAGTVTEATLTRAPGLSGSPSP